MAVMGMKSLLGASAAIIVALVYQFLLRDIIFIGLGIGRTHNKLSDYPYTCRRLRSPLLESCEDIVIDHEDRRLYTTCSTVASRKEWSPGGDKFNASGRGLTDHVSVLNLDDPSQDGFYGLRTLDITGSYRSSTGDKVIDVHGFDIEVLSATRLRFWMINHRPPVDNAGNLLDTKIYGANSTIEVFEHTRGSTTLEHIKTIISDAVFTPNNLVASGDGGVLITNDHNSKTPDLLRPLERILGGGNVAYCSLSSSACHIASPANHTFYFANGITKSSSSNLIYVASTAKGAISTFQYISSSQMLRFVETIPVGMCIDNLSVDEKGNVFAAGFPKVFEFMASLEIPDTDVGSAVLKTRKGEAVDGVVKHVVEKVLEDSEGRSLPGATVAVHDARTDSYWLGGVASPYVTVCHGRDHEDEL